MKEELAKEQQVQPPQAQTQVAIPHLEEHEPDSSHSASGGEAIDRESRRVTPDFKTKQLNEVNAAVKQSLAETSQQPASMPVTPNPIPEKTGKTYDRFNRTIEVSTLELFDDPKGSFEIDCCAV